MLWFAWPRGMLWITVYAFIEASTLAPPSQLPMLHMHNVIAIIQNVCHVKLIDSSIVSWSRQHNSNQNLPMSARMPATLLHLC